AIEWARASQHEVYDPMFRRWHWRMCFEQTVYSHSHFEPGAETPPYLKNVGRTLLMAGSEDNFTGANIYTWTRDLAPKMIQDRGRSIFLEGVGHSIPAEKPGLMTHQVVQFLVKEAGIKPTAANAFAQWRTTSVTFDQRGNGGIEGNVAVRG